MLNSLMSAFYNFENGNLFERSENSVSTLYKNTTHFLVAGQKLNTRMLEVICTARKSLQEKNELNINSDELCRRRKAINTDSTLLRLSMKRNAHGGFILDKNRNPIISLGSRGMKTIR